MSRAAALWAALCCCYGADLRFHAAGGGEFRFDTGVLHGTFRSQGRSIGLLPVTHAASGTVLARSMGLFGVYRVFSGGRRFGNGMWSWPSEASLAPSGAVTVRWPPAAGRPFEMKAAYRWAGPETLDVEISVTPEEDLRGFETFLASYFGEQFTRAAVPARVGGFLAAEEDQGRWQMFPRSAASLVLIRDGRWKIPPNPVDWAIRPEFEWPLAVRRAPASGLAAVVMAPAEDCFSVATPHQTDPHYSLYLSLFGRDAGKGETARARARLAVLEAADEGRIRKLYSDYLRALSQDRRTR